MYYVSPVFNRLALILALCGLGVAAMFSLRLATADHWFRQRTPEAVTRALETFPGNTSYLAFRALQLQYDNQDATPLLERAAQLNPLASEPRIRLGLAAETRGDIALAEKWLLDAAAVDLQYEPRWTLANFYFRHGRRDDFWQWMLSALAVSYGDRRPAFDLCWRMSASPAEILARAIPQVHDVMSSYLSYVMNQHREATETIAQRLAALHRADDVALLEAACDLLIEMGNSSQAKELWRLLGHRGTLLTNGSFEETPRDHGFDWRIWQQTGVKHANLTAPALHRISLSGMQAESCELLRQYVVLTPGKRYRLGWEARTQSLSSPTGIEWAAGNNKLALDNTADWHGGSMSFSAQAGLSFVVLTYRRPQGQPRAQGTVEIRNVVLVEDGS